MSASEMLAAAGEALGRARCPYRPEEGRVGAAVATDRGVFAGATFQHCAYPNSICAVQAAVVSALSEGARKIHCVGVRTAEPSRRRPRLCGRCRSLVAEHAVSPRAKIYFNGENDALAVADYLPDSPDFLDDAASAAAAESAPWRRPATEAVYDFAPDAPADPALRKLMLAAVGACAKAFVPMSEFPVGAAVLVEGDGGGGAEGGVSSAARSGTCANAGFAAGSAAAGSAIITGSNIESRVLGLTLCAERTALSKAVSAGAPRVRALAVACYKMATEFSSPCGGCRQSLLEFDVNLPVYLLRVVPGAGAGGRDAIFVKKTSPAELAPDGFSAASLGVLPE